MEDDDASGLMKREDCIDLPPGFRFHPTDEEIITHYLLEKVLNSSFSATAVGEVDLNKCEPWDLPRKAKMGEKEWYFFCLRDRKYPSGMRTNRATEAGYWKATGKDREIFKGKDCLVGMKKTLVFYRGRAPKGEKTSWVMNEYRLEGKFSHHTLPSTAKEAWVVCKVFHKRTQVDNNTSPAVLYLSRTNSYDDEDHGRLDSSNYCGPADSSSFRMSRPEEDDEELKRKSMIMRTSLVTCDDNDHHDQKSFAHNNINSYQAFQYHNMAPNPTLSPHDQLDVVGFGGTSSDFGYLPQQPISSRSSNLAGSSNDNQAMIFDKKMVFSSTDHIIEQRVPKMSSSVSQETAGWSTAAMNTEMYSSAVSKNNYMMMMMRSSSSNQDQQEPPSSSCGPLVDLEFLWNC